MFKFICEKYFEVSEHLIFRSDNVSPYSRVLVFDPVQQVFSVLAAAGLPPLSSRTVILQRRLRPEWGLKAYRKPESSLLILLSHLLLSEKTLSLLQSLNLSLLFSILPVIFLLIL